jgi:hypothetical protein
MPVPWLRILNTVIGVTDVARLATGRAGLAGREGGKPGRGPLGLLEARLAGVFVAAIKEAFDRDSRRLELEREQMEAERRRAEKALKLELLRQAADREIGRLRLAAGLAAAGWVASLLVTGRIVAGGGGGRVALAGGWVLLLSALVSAFSAERRVAAAVGRMDDLMEHGELIGSGAAGVAAAWLIGAGLLAVSVALLVA